MAKASAAQMVEDIRTATKAKSGGIRLSSWEAEFFENVSKRVENNLPITEKQLESLEAIWDKI